ncbi:hypothetical protein PT974_08235 [Cladobotryum mycophilum]|uniref:Uncharacterized protein n=1 Tax=Cladobotryum mycophilum TaxID=491253 RepID=A0ABR0SDR1_9HYPO
MHDFSPEGLFHVPIKPEPHLKTQIETNGFESLAVMASEAPYRLPAEMDLARIGSVLGAGARAAEDHILTLREDPADFVHYLL